MMHHKVWKPRPTNFDPHPVFFASTTTTHPAWHLCPSHSSALAVLGILDHCKHLRLQRPPWHRESSLAPISLSRWDMWKPCGEIGRCTHRISNRISSDFIGSQDLVRSQGSQGDFTSPSKMALPSQVNTLKGRQFFDLDLIVRSFLHREVGPVQTTGSRSNPFPTSTSLWRRCKFQRRTPTVLASQEPC